MINTIKFLHIASSIQGFGIIGFSATAGFVAEVILGENSGIQIGLVVSLTTILGGALWTLGKLLFKAGREFEHVKNELSAAKMEIITVHERGTKILSRIELLEKEHEQRCKNFCPKDDK